MKDSDLKNQIDQQIVKFFEALNPGGQENSDVIKVEPVNEEMSDDIVNYSEPIFKKPSKKLKRKK